MISHFCVLACKTFATLLVESSCNASIAHSTQCLTFCLSEMCKNYFDNVLLFLNTRSSRALCLKSILETSEKRLTRFRCHEDILKIYFRPIRGSRFSFFFSSFILSTRSAAISSDQKRAKRLAIEDTFVSATVWITMFNSRFLI